MNVKKLEYITLIRQKFEKNQSISVNKIKSSVGFSTEVFFITKKQIWITRAVSDGNLKFKT